MKVAVTGASGYIGRHVVAALERRSVSPVLLCRSTANLPAALRRHTSVSIDLRQPPACVFSLAGEPDVLIHLAWGGLPNYNSRHHFEEELPAHYRFLQQMVEGGIASMLVTGTCFEYGMESGPLREDSESRPDNPYGFAKDALRRQLQFLQSAKSFNLTWARLFYSWGEGQAANSLRPQLEKAVSRGDRNFNMSGGEQLRDYLPVEEVAGMLVSLALSLRDHGVVNICSGAPISVRKLVEQWVVENGWEISLNRGFYRYPSYEPMAFWGDREKLDRCLESQS